MVFRVHLRIVNRLLPLAMILALAAASSFGATYNLRAAATQVTMPDGAVVTMWGYALVSYNVGAGTVPGDNVPRVPGPALTVPPGHTLLTVNLTNNLPPGNGTSIVIPGLRGALTPVKTADAQGRQRIRSFTAVIPPGGSGSYTFTGIKPGTYLYHSGTQPQVQVQMGLYGAVSINSVDLVPSITPGQAYPGKTFLNEAILFYSEIDPDLHAAVESDNYGPGKAVTSTFNYKPKYFLINGQPFPGQTAPPTAKAIDLNEPMLLRFLSASLKHHAPVLLGSEFDVIAEDGNLYPYPKRQHSVALSPLKTYDVLWTPSTAGRYPLYDRALGLTNGTQLGGGMLTYLTAGPVAGAPVAVADAFAATEDTVLNAPAPGVLGNDTDPAPVGPGPLTAVLVNGAANGTVTLNADGSFIYTPKLNFSGTDTFKYKANDGANDSNVATVTITVAAVNDAPLAGADAATTTGTAPVTISVLANDSDPDGNPLTVSITTPPAKGVASVNANNTITYTPNNGLTLPTTDTLVYSVSDGTLSATATVTVTITARVNIPPAAVDDTVSTKKNTPITINVIANDTDDIGVVGSTVQIINGPNMGGAVVNNLNGTVTYTPKRNFAGSEMFSYTVKDTDGATSNKAWVKVNVK